MPDAHSIPFRQAAGNGHYESKQLPDDNADFLVVLGLPTSVGNVTSASVSTLDGQLAAYWGTSGSVIKASTQIGLVNLVDGVVTTKATPAGEIVGTTAVQTLTNKTLITPAITGTVTGLDKSSVGLGNVDNTSDANKPVSGPQQTALNLKEDKANKGVALGYASLDATGKVVASQLPATVVGSMRYQGTWNSAVNIPTLPVASVGNQGWYYVVSVAGTTSIDGIADWGVGDWVVSNGTAWNKIDNTDAVSSVVGRTGDIVLVKADVGLGNVDNTSDATKNAAAATLTNKTINGVNNILIVRLDADVTNSLPVNRLNGGIGAGANSFWCGDGQWKTPSGGGNVTGSVDSVDGEIVLFDGLTGKLIKRPTPVGTGVVSVVNGVYQEPIDGVMVADTTQTGNPSNAVVIPSFVGCPDGVFAPGGSVMDDHFDGTVIDGKWSNSQTAGIVNPLYQVAGSRLTLAGGSPSTTDGIGYGNNSGVTLPNTNDFTITVRVDAILYSRPFSGSIGSFDIRLHNATSNVGCAYRFHNAWASTPQVSTLNSAIYGGSGIATQVTTWFISSVPKYLKMVFAAATRIVTLYYSDDGNVYHLWGTVTAAQSGFTAVILPQTFRMVVQLVNGGFGMAHVDWVKFTNP